MPLTAGKKLGPYEVEAPLGAGGMGEVYRARDTRLDRTVAVKILPAHLADNSEARQRFEREARTISSLNHPHICVLHDVGNDDGVAYLVMEYVQGESMESRLQRGPLPLKQALEYGVQICDALEKAHRAGIVHRDLKPGNIMLSASGAKLLDFGLAKPVTSFGPSTSQQLGNLTPSTPTINFSTLGAAPAITQHGSIVGTFQFMAPELLQGHEADARSDIFSFGCVLYEMVTGKRAFEGKSQISVASAILEKDPEPVAKIQPTIPPALDHVIQDCLVKDPEVRWQNAADIARQLRWIGVSGSGVSAAPEIPRNRNWIQYLPWAALAALLLAALLWWTLRPSLSVRAVRSFLPPPADLGFDFTGDFSGPPVLSADGSAIAFCARTRKDRNSIWVQSLNEITAKKLEGTEGASFPFWSADAKYLGFFAEGQLKKVPSAGGPVTILADAPNPRGGAWNQDNVILYEPDYRDSLWRVSANGADARRLTRLDGGRHTTHRWPRFLPDGKHFLFFATSHAGSSEQGIYFGSLSDGSYKRVVDSDSDAQYASGYLLFHLQSQLFAQKFDASTGAVSGDPAPIANLVEYDTGTWHTTFAASQNGLLVYEPGSKTLGTDLYWMDRSGKILRQLAERAFYKGTGRLSPDGKKLVLAAGDPQADIWVLDLARGSRTRLTFGGATHNSPSWSPNGERIVYVRQSGTTVVKGTAICSRLANGGGQEEVLMQSDPSPTPTALLMPQWSPDGKYLVHVQQAGPLGASIWALPAGQKTPIPILKPQAPQSRIVQYRLSPDGHWLAYSSTESGREEVYVTHFPDGEGRWQISQNGGTFPEWRRDGKEIYYVGIDLALYASAVSTKNQEFEADPGKKLFQVNYVGPLGNPYDVSADGKNFVFATYPESVSTPLVLVTNWNADLNK